MVEEMLVQIEGIYTIESLNQKIILFNKLITGLLAFGYQDYQRPKSKKGMDFESLDIKSIRILNRLVKHV